VTVDNLECTCDACPTQWEFDTDFGQRGYVRYRFGRLSISLISRVGFGMVELFSKVLNKDNAYDGMVEWDEVVPYVEEIIVPRDAVLIEPQQAAQQVAQSIGLRKRLRIQINREELN
jgi:hypothetical protein